MRFFLVPIVAMALVLAAPLTPLVASSSESTPAPDLKVTVTMSTPPLPYRLTFSVVACNVGDAPSPAGILLFSQTSLPGPLRTTENGPHYFFLGINPLQPGQCIGTKGPMGVSSAEGTFGEYFFEWALQVAGDENRENDSGSTFAANPSALLGSGVGGNDRFWDLSH